MKNQRFEIGHKFMTRGKHPKERTIIDVHKTYNNAGDLVKIEYVAEHEFLGQKIKTVNLDSTVAMGTKDFQA